MHFAFLLQAPTHHVVILIRDFYMSQSRRSVSLKLCVGFSIFDSISFLFKFSFLKKDRLCEFKT